MLKRSSILNMRFTCPSESHPATSFAVVSSVSTMFSWPKTSRNKLSSSSCTDTNYLLITNDLDKRSCHDRIFGEIVDPFRRPVPLTGGLEAEAGEEIAYKVVLPSRHVETAELRATSGRRGEAQLLKNA